MNKKFLATAFTLSGTIIGAGILGLPYVFSKSGFLIGVFWLIAIGAIMIFMNLTMGGITLRTKESHQLPGYANKYLGKWGKRLMFLALATGIYSALLAYLIGEGSSFAKLIPMNISPMFYGIIFWMFMTSLLGYGLKELKRIEIWGVFAIIAIIVGMFFRYISEVNFSNLMIINTSSFIVPIGVVLFAMLGFTSIPELRKEIKGEEKFFKKAIILGSLIPVILYVLFSMIFIGVLGLDVSEVATLSFGSVIIILGIFTMLPSYFILSYVLHDIFKYDLKANRFISVLFTSAIPLILYIIVTVFNLASFNTILGIGGTVSGGLTGILILLMAKKAKDDSNSHTGIDIPINLPIIIIFSLIFLAAIVLQFVF